MENVVIKPISTEKSIRLMEAENKLIFLVNKKASKEDIKKDVEVLFDAKVQSVNTMISPKGEKRAYVKFTEETPAIDVAVKLGLM